jgi:UDP-glucose 4-epimerase
LRSDKLKFIIGDVRDQSSIEQAIKGSNFVFHAAALKQVPSCEFFPIQANFTNVIGSSNVLDLSIKYGVESVVCLSSDKAVYPINAMGMTKALMEKVAQSYSRNIQNGKTRIAITRYGNVMMSRGSVIPQFIKQIREGLPVSITDPTMTRFLMSLDDSVELVKFAFTNANSGDIFVKKSPACSIQTLAHAITRVLGVEGQVQFQNIGIRHGEKRYESLLGTEERSRSLDMGQYFRVPLDSRSLDYQIYFSKGQQEVPLPVSYTSENTDQMGVDDVVKLVAALPEFIEFMKVQI